MTTPNRHEWNRSERDGSLAAQDRDFVEGVLRRFDRRRQQRKGLIVGSCLLAVILVTLLMLFVPVPEAGSIVGGLRDVVAALLLTALCAVAWIVADTGGSGD